ncbi:hypothetical protein [Corynebacterium glyciniphilum]|uniref:hypothetical protein n=1 Tax=Corynebacterium glyciniphilum TaxID=1404244 RepID=UPI002352D8EE
MSSRHGGSTTPDPTVASAGWAVTTQRLVKRGGRSVLKDYPTPENCTSPYASARIAEMVSRQSDR